jgi:hypothetical protein
LIIYTFTSRSRHFHLDGDVTIVGEGLQNLGLCSALRAFEQGRIVIVCVRSLIHVQWSNFWYLHLKIIRKCWQYEYDWIQIPWSDHQWRPTRSERSFPKGFNTLNFLRQNLKYYPSEAKTAPYISLVRSTLKYSTSIWDPYLEKEKSKIERVNRSPARKVRHWRLQYSQQRDNNAGTTMLEYASRTAPANTSSTHVQEYILPPANLTHYHWFTSITWKTCIYHT